MNNYPTYLIHFGVKGQKWGYRRYQNEDGTLTQEGKNRNKNIKQANTANKVAKVAALAFGGAMGTKYFSDSIKKYRRANNIIKNVSKKPVKELLAKSGSKAIIIAGANALIAYASIKLIFAEIKRNKNK